MYNKNYAFNNTIAIASSTDIGDYDLLYEIKFFTKTVLLLLKTVCYLALKRTDPVIKFKFSTDLWDISLQG